MNVSTTIITSHHRQGIAEPMLRYSSYMAMLLPFVATVVAGDLTVMHAAEPPITTIAFSSDGSQLVVGSQSGLRCFAWPNLSEPQPIDIQVGNIQNLEFSPDGRYLAVCGGYPADSGRCQIISWPRGRVLCTLDHHQDVVAAVAWSKTSEKIATASMDATVVVSTLKTTPERLSASSTIEVEGYQAITGHSKGVLAVRFLADSMLLTAGIDRSIRVWQLDSSEPHLVRTLENHTEAIQALVERPAVDDGLPVFVSIGEDRTVRLWQPTIGRMMRFARLKNAVPLSAQWQANGSSIVVGCDDGHVRLIDPDSTEVVAEWPVNVGWCYCLAVHPKTNQVVVGGPDGLATIALK
jgi:WD40 repeat protein